MLISLFFATLIFFMVLAMFTGAPMVMSKKATAEKMIDLLKPKKGEVMCDLGSGDGRLLILAAKKGAQAIGVEINPYILIWSWIKALVNGQMGQIKLIWGSYWYVNIHSANCVAIYAMPGFMEKMSRKLIQELKPGTRVVSNSFQIPRLRLIKQELVGRDRIFLYRI